jgi:phage terminase small subunit
VDVREEAKRLFLEEHLPPVEIARRLGIPAGTIRGWKSKDLWEPGTLERRNVPERSKPIEKHEPESGLTDAQEVFCQAFIRTFNASSAYRASHPESTHRSAWSNGYRMLQNEKVRTRIEQLKAEKFKALMVNQDDVIELYMRIAFADIGDFVEWGRDTVPVMGPFGPIELKDEETGEKIMLTKDINVVRFRESADVDRQILAEVKQGRDGASVKMLDKQKALDFLAQYFLMNPLDRHRVDYDKKRLEIEEWKVNGNPDASLDVAKQSQAIADLINSPAGERRIEDHMPSGGAVDDPIRASDEASD